MQMFSILKHAVMIRFFVFVMMLLVDFIEIASKGRMSGIIKGSRWRQYTLASFWGSTPGCLGAFMNVSLYVHGLISFGAIVGGMIATSFVQDGHSLLPILSYSLKDSALIKAFNLAFGLTVGGALFVLGL